MQSEQFQLHAQIEQRHWWFVARREILRELVRTISPPLYVANKSPGMAIPGLLERKTIVDIGCGTGANLAAFTDEYGCTGIDASAEAIELAKQRFPGINFVCGEAPGDVEQWLAQASVVLLTDVLEHVADDRGLLASIVNACPLGTKFLITVPADMRLWSPHDEAFGHYRRYNAEGFSALWSELPVKLRLLSHLNSRLYPAVRLVRSVSRWRGKAGGVSNTDFRLPSRPVNSILQSIFAGEQRALVAAIDAQHTPFRRGVSLIAILEREESLTSGFEDNLFLRGNADIIDETDDAMPLGAFRL